MCLFVFSLIIRRAFKFDLYTVDYVHLLPGYPSNVSGLLLIAFYVQQPPGLFIGNISVLPSSTLSDIILMYKSELESAIGATISDVKALFTPTLSTEREVEPTGNNKRTWIVIGVSVGVLIIIMIIGIVLWW